MNKIRLLISGLLIILMAPPVHALEQNREQLKSGVTQNLPSGTGSVTALSLRNQLFNLTDSAFIRNTDNIGNIAPIGTDGQYFFNSGGQIVAGGAGNLALFLDLSAVALTGSYSDLTGRPSIPSATSDLTNNSGFITASGAPVQSVNGLTGAVTLNSFSTAIKINGNASSLPSARTGTLLQVGNANATASRIEADSFGAPGFFTSLRYDGTAASPTALQSGDEIGGYNAWGYNGTAAVGPQASYRVYAAQNWTGSANGTYADIAVTPNNSTALTSSIRFENDGGVTVPPGVIGGDKGAGTINATGLYVNGTAVVTPNTAATYTAQQNFGTATLTDAATINWNLATAQAAKVVLGGDRIMAAPTNMVDGGNYTLRLIEDATGNRHVTWNSVFKWPSGSAPILSSGANKVDLVSCQSDGTNMLCVATMDLR